MKWMTEAHVKKQAIKSEWHAWKCSLDHWLQMYNARAGELRRAKRNGKASWGSYLCALCERHCITCISCSLRFKRKSCLHNTSLYQQVRVALNLWYSRKPMHFSKVKPKMRTFIEFIVNREPKK